MTKYKQYLFEEAVKGPFQKPDLSNFPFSGKEELYKQEIERLSQINTPIVKQDKKSFTNLIVGFNSCEILNNGQFLKLSLSTKDGAMDGKVWGGKDNKLEEYQEDLEPGTVYSISGKWNEWPAGSGKYSAIIDSYIPSRENASAIVPYIQENIVDLEKEIRFYISTLSEEVAEFATKLLDEIWDAFSVAPAAMGHHHFQLGGLLQHTVELLRIAHPLLDKNEEELENILCYVRKLSEKATWNEMKKHRDENPSTRFYSSFFEGEDHMLTMFNKLMTAWKTEKPNRDVVIFSIIFHDMGKIIEYSYANELSDKYDLFFPGMHFEKKTKSIGVSMDTNGSRLGHITLGMMFLHQFFIREESPEGDLLINVLACLSSHHGKKEWGSPTCPVTTNEYLVHICDYLDAKFASEK
jgi:23S rRNA maturation-related 3'-5' exoribonuclease YhaM